LVEKSADFATPTLKHINKTRSLFIISH